MENELINFRTFDNAIEANIVKAKLEDAGIPCFLTNEHFLGLNPIYANATGGIKLVIQQNDVFLANELLRRSMEAYEEELRCKICMSNDVHFVTSHKTLLNWISVFFSFLFGNYPLYLKKVYHCDSCGNEFERIEQKTTE